MASNWALLRAHMQAVRAQRRRNHEGPQLFISTPLEPKREVAESAAPTPALPKVRQRRRKEEKEATPEPQLVCTPRMTPDLVDMVHESAKSTKSESPQQATKTKAEESRSVLRPVKSESKRPSTGSPTGPVEELRIGTPSAPKARRSRRQMTVTPNRPSHHKLLRHATVAVDGSEALVALGEPERSTSAIGDDESEYGWRHALTMPTSPWTEEAETIEAPELPSRQASKQRNDELDDLEELPLEDESLQCASPGLQRFPSSSSQQSKSSHQSQWEDLGQQSPTEDSKQQERSRTRSSSKHRDRSEKSKENPELKRKTSLRRNRSDSDEGKQHGSKKTTGKRKTSRGRSGSRASSGSLGHGSNSRRPSDASLGKRSSRGSRSPKSSALHQQRKSLRARFASEVPEAEWKQKSGKVAFLRKAWSQARCALLGLQEPQVEDDNDPRAKGLRGWDAARALCIGTGRALRDVKGVVNLVKRAADEAYHRHRVQKTIVEEIATTLSGSMANVSNEMDETIGDVLADLTRLKWKDMTEIGALVCEAILNFDEDGEEQADVTSPASLRDQLLEHVQTLPNREDVLRMDDTETEALLDHIMHQTENLRDQLKTSVLCSLEPHRQKHRSKLRDSGTVSHLSGMDTVELEEKESVQSILSRLGSRADAAVEGAEVVEPVPVLPVVEAPLAPVPVPPAPPSRPSPRVKAAPRSPRTANQSCEEDADNLPMLVSSSSTLPREARSPPRPPRPKPQQELQFAGFSDAAGLLEVSKRSVIYAAMTTFPYMQTFPVVLAPKVPNPEMREVSSTGAVLPILVMPRPLSPHSRRHAGDNSP